MENLEHFLRFLSSYPTWAKVFICANIVCALAVMIFAPRKAGSNGARTEPRDEDA